MPQFAAPFAVSSTPAKSSGSLAGSGRLLMTSVPFPKATVAMRLSTKGGAGVTWTLARRGGARFGHAGARGQGAASRGGWVQTRGAVLGWQELLRDVTLRGPSPPRREGSPGATRPNLQKLK